MMKLPWALLGSSALFLLGGCHHYYEIQDTRTGHVYYTEGWVAADGYSGPLRFTDSTGRHIDLRDSQVTRMAKDDYLQVTEDSHQSESPQ